MSLTVTPVRGLRGEITIPGDKSISHRAVMLGALAQGETTITNFLPGADCLATVRCLRALGVEIEGLRDDALRVRGVGLSGMTEPGDVLDAGNSGTTMRLLLGILAGQEFFSVLTGDASLRRRPMGRVTAPLTAMGATILGRDGGRRAPLAIVGGRLRGLDYRLPVASAQLKSALLLAGLYADGRTRLTEPVPSRDHTERMLAAFGASVVRENNRITVEPQPALRGREVAVPGDFSSAAFLLVAALITPDSDLVVRNVGVNPTRTGLLEVLTAMGARITVGQVRTVAGEPVADLRVRSSRLRGTVAAGALIPRLIDEIPVLAVAAAFAEGITEIRDAGELRVKESDRLAALRRELGALGAAVRERPDGLVIEGRKELRGGACRSHGDHRIAMALAVAGLASRYGTVIANDDCIRVSYPGFSDALKTVCFE